MNGAERAPADQLPQLVAVGRGACRLGRHVGDLVAAAERSAGGPATGRGRGLSDRAVLVARGATACYKVIAEPDQCAEQPASDAESPQSPMPSPMLLGKAGRPPQRWQPTIDFDATMLHP